jgi:DNA repair protein RadC
VKSTHGTKIYKDNHQPFGEIPVSRGADKVLKTTEMWERLRDWVSAQNASVENALAEIHTKDWKEFSPRHRAALAIACALDLPYRSPQDKRQALHLLEQLENENLLCVPSQQDLVSISEPTEPYQSKLGFDKRRWLAKGLHWILSPVFSTELQQASGPVAAFHLLRKKAPILKQHRSALFLSQLGYPIIVPDNPHRRFFHRYQGKNITAPTIKNMERTIQLGDALARTLCISTLECNLYIGSFSGSKDSPPIKRSVCSTSPNCLSCPIAQGCYYAGFLAEHGDLHPQEEKKRHLDSLIPANDQPREKLRRLGPGALSNSELLAILLRTGTKKEHVLELSQRLLKEVGDSLGRLENASLKELIAFNGLGEVKATTIKAALELGRRLDNSSHMEQQALTNSKSIFQSQRLFFLNKQEEVFVSLLLDSKNRILRRVIITQGTINRSLIHPGQAFREAVRDSALRVVFLHNHPSGDPTPSTQDINITAILKKGGEILGITVLDHLIIGKESYYSFADEGKL